MNPNDIKQSVKEAVERITTAMNLQCQAEVGEGTHSGKTVITVAIQAPEHARFLIGKNGQNLQALEHVVRAIALKDTGDSMLVSVDVNDYKKSRANRVLEMARQVVARVRNTHRAEALMPMSSYERRVVHMELASVPDIVTESIGQEPQRRIIIKPY